MLLYTCFPKTSGVCVLAWMSDKTSVAIHAFKEICYIHWMCMLILTRCVASHDVYAQKQWSWDYIHMCVDMAAVYDKTSCLSSTPSFCIDLANLHWWNPFFEIKVLRCKLIKVCVYSYRWFVAKINFAGVTVLCRHALEAFCRSQLLLCTGAFILVYALVWHHAVYLLVWLYVFTAYQAFQVHSNCLAEGFLWLPSNHP